MPESRVVVELKKERLTRHLDQVEVLLSQWLGELSDPGLFYREVEFSPQNIHIALYQTLLERDEEVNHQLRSHLSSRALWRHHTDWTRLHSALAKSVNKLVDVGMGRMELLAQEEGIRPTLWFLNSALEDAFATVVDGVSRTAQPELDSHGGVIYRSNKIETGALPEELEKVARALRRLTYILRVRPEMAVLSGLWTEMKQHEHSIIQIGGDTLKASDIFYSCRFCRKLFK